MIRLEGHSMSWKSDGDGTWLSGARVDDLHARNILKHVSQVSLQTGCIKNITGEQH